MIRQNSFLNVLICGGGKTGHLNSVLFKQEHNVNVNMLTFNQQMVQLHREHPNLEITARLPDGDELKAVLNRISNNPKDVVPDADLVLVTVPAHIREQVLISIKPFLPVNKPVYIGAIPGFCGFDWLAQKVFCDMKNIVIWGMKDVPHTAFNLDLGRSISMGGAKSQLYIATHDRENQDMRNQIKNIIQRLYHAPVRLLDSYLEITMTPGNPIMHSPIIYGLIGPYAQWYNRYFDRKIYWWTDACELGAYFMERCDQENQALCRYIEQYLNIDLSSVEPLKKEIVDAYSDQISDSRTMFSVLRTNRAYQGIEVALVGSPDGKGYQIDTNSRVFHEDISFGLALLVEMGRRLSLSIPYMTEIYKWCEGYMGGAKNSSLAYFPVNWPHKANVQNKDHNYKIESDLVNAEN